MSKLDELIGSVRTMADYFERGDMIALHQQVLGKDRPTCIACGNCPSALLQELEEARRDITEQPKDRSQEAPDVQ